MHDLVTRSLAIIEANQAPNGAYVACPTFLTYHYCWFRDGTFIAYAMDLWHRHESAARFYTWAAQNVVERADHVERCLKAAAENLPLNPMDLLDTRYTLDGQVGEEEWPNFQLDGFSTLLWGLQQYVELSGASQLPPAWAQAAGLLVRYLHALWQYPNYDCWEEFPERIAVSTLAALYAGLHAISSAAGLDPQHSELAAQTAASIKTFVLNRGVRSGHLVKQIDGTDVVDASLLWAAVPFAEHGLLQAGEPLMQETVARIATDLVGGCGGVHRYRADTYYGGGEWILLTALLGEYYAATGETAAAQRCLAFIEAHANECGELPEQITTAALDPSYIAQWVTRWGHVAQPLLWSHANYLSLYTRLQPINDKVEQRVTL